jgi:hypothetical protein
MDRGGKVDLGPVCGSNDSGARMQVMAQVMAQLGRELS